MKFCRSPVVRRLIVWALMVALILSGSVAYPTQLRAEETLTAPIMTTNATDEYVTRVKKLATFLYNKNGFNSQNGGNMTIDNKSTGNESFTWDSESQSNNKYRSWSYFNGIMMDAFLVLDSDSYISKVTQFYEANIGSAGTILKDKPNNSNTNKNEYKKLEWNDYSYNFA